MKVRDITAKLEERYPLGCAEEWDNPGLMVGRYNAGVKKILVCLDVTDDIIAQAVSEGADLIAAHHPLIFGTIDRVTDDRPTGRRILQLAEHNIACYAMHTNFDVRRMGDLNAAQLHLKNSRVLDVTGVDAYGLDEGIGRVGDLERPLPLSEFALFVKKQLCLEEVRCYGPEGSDPIISRAAVCGGAGRSTIPCALEAGADVIVTGDLTHHAALDAMAEGLCLIDAGHFGTEICFVEHAAAELAEMFPECEVICAKSSQPFQIV